MKITILGCGPSYGVPSLTRGFDQVDPPQVLFLVAMGKIQPRDIHSGFAQGG